MEKERNIKKNDKKKLDGRWIEHSACQKLQGGQYMLRLL
jgi:hypothetical protein